MAVEGRRTDPERLAEVAHADPVVTITSKCFQRSVHYAVAGGGHPPATPFHRFMSLLTSDTVRQVLAVSRRAKWTLEHRLPCDLAGRRTNMDERNQQESGQELQSPKTTE